MGYALRAAEALGRVESTRGLIRALAQDPNTDAVLHHERLSATSAIRQLHSHFRKLGIARLIGSFGSIPALSGRRAARGLEGVAAAVPQEDRQDRITPLPVTDRRAGREARATESGQSS
jgi:hypothetical protein